MRLPRNSWCSSFFDYFSSLLEEIIVSEDVKFGQEFEPGCDRTFFFSCAYANSKIHLLAMCFCEMYPLLMFPYCHHCYFFHINILKDVFACMCIFIILRLLRYTMGGY